MKCSICHTELGEEDNVIEHVRHDIHDAQYGIRPDGLATALANLTVRVDKLEQLIKVLEVVHSAPTPRSRHIINPLNYRKKKLGFRVIIYGRAHIIICYLTVRIFLRELLPEMRIMENYTAQTKKEISATFCRKPNCKRLFVANHVGVMKEVSRSWTVRLCFGNSERVGDTIHILPIAIP